MTARILVVDDIPTNIKVLEARLRSDYYEVLAASSGKEGLAIAANSFPDLALLDVMMPEMDGFEVCRKMKADPLTAHIPVIMVTALDGVEDRVRGLEAGADDFLTKPIDETALMARIRNLVRLKLMRDELRLRQGTAEALALIAPDQASETIGKRKVVFLEDNAASARRISAALTANPDVAVDVAATPQDAFRAMADAAPDLIIVTLTSQNFDGLRACSAIRTMEFLRQVPLLVVADGGQKDVLLRALDLGVNDYLLRPVDRNELIARVQTQFRWKIFQDRLRESYRQSVELATTDPLTGLYNRRYLTTHLDRLVVKAREKRKSCSLLILDIDHFKLINDRFGHPVGDKVLIEVAERMKINIRGIDLACRYGGEEFVVLMPEAEIDAAVRVGSRLREAIAEKPIEIPAVEGGLPVTVSIGVAALDGSADDCEALISRADKALYAAKKAGRNRVERAAA